MNDTGQGEGSSTTSNCIPRKQDSIGKQTTYFLYDNTGNATVGGLAACSFPFWTAPTKKCLWLVPSSLKKTGPLSPSKAVSGPEIVRKLCRNARRPGPELFKTSSASRIAS